MFLFNKSQKKIITNVISVLLLSVILFFNMWSLGIKAFSAIPQQKYIFIVGDSRTCSLVNSLKTDSSYSYKYCNINEPFYDAIIEKDGITIVIFGEGGGYFKKGSLERSLSRMNQFISENPNVLNNEIYYFDLFGLNDLIYDRKNRYQIPSLYINKDKEMGVIYPQIKKIYHFNVGPITEDGIFYNKHILSNSFISEFNSSFTPDEYIEIIDLYTYLTYSGYDTYLDVPEESTKSGIHYDIFTDFKLIELIKALAN